MTAIEFRKPNELFETVTSDIRWDINDQTMFNVFSLTFYGYSFGVLRLIHFMEGETINNYVKEKLIDLGAGEKYVNGLIDFAFSTFQQQTEGTYSELVGIGYSHFANQNLTEITESILKNTEVLKNNDL